MTPGPRPPAPGSRLPAHARTCLAEFRKRYNTRRPHWPSVPEGGGDPLRPQDVYVGGAALRPPRWQQWAIEAKRRLNEMTQTQVAQPAKTLT